jgi:hypothetical protein
VVELAILFNGRLGWMKRSDPHQFRFVVVMGFADPSCTLLAFGTSLLM